MRSELMKYALAEVPRYTSYPTAVQFHNGVGEDTYRAWLKELGPEQKLSVYVHVPFCRQMCWYCGCHTTVVHNYDRVGAYATTLKQELTLLDAALGEHGGVSHVHFGGGTPTILTEEDFAIFMAELTRRIPLRAGAEVAVEIDPRTLSNKKAEGLAEAGVTRASLGVQDFSPEVQELIHRPQPYKQVVRAMEWLRGAGITAINFDIMYGLPGQTEEVVRQTVDLAVGLKPDRIAVFGYAHVPWFKKHQQMIDEAALPGVDERIAQAGAAAEAFKAQGYVEIGFDHYAREGDSMAVAVRAGTLHRNFQGYTNDAADALIGLGASSIGSLPKGYVQNVPDLGQYSKSVGEGHLPIVRGVELTDEDRLRRAAIERILCDLALDVGAHCRKFGRKEDALDDAFVMLAQLEQDGLIDIDGRKLTVREEGRRFLRTVATAFDTHFKPSAKRHSRAV